MLGTVTPVMGTTAAVLRWQSQLEPKQTAPLLAQCPHLCTWNNGLPSPGNTEGSMSQPKSYIWPYISKHSSCLPWPLWPLKISEDPFSQRGALEAELANWEALRGTSEPPYNGFLYKSSPLLSHTGRARAVCGLSTSLTVRRRATGWQGSQSEWGWQTGPHWPCRSIWKGRTLKRRSGCAAPRDVRREQDVLRNKNASLSHLDDCPCFFPVKGLKRTTEDGRGGETFEVGKPGMSAIWKALSEWGHSTRSALERSPSPCVIMTAKQLSSGVQTTYTGFCHACSRQATAHWPPRLEDENQPSWLWLLWFFLFN